MLPPVLSNDRTHLSKGVEVLSYAAAHGLRRDCDHAVPMTCLRPVTAVLLPRRDRDNSMRLLLACVTHARRSG